MPEKIAPAAGGVKTVSGGYRADMRSLLGLLVIAWLVIGAVAAGQRGYYGDDRDVSCKTFSDTALTIVAGPLNYMGVNPKVKCKVPEPSR
ncbi:hypothetical protein GCM10027448_00800 [Nocardioides dilutus]